MQGFNTPYTHAEENSNARARPTHSPSRQGSNLAKCEQGINKKNVEIGASRNEDTSVC